MSKNGWKRVLYWVVGIVVFVGGVIPTGVGAAKLLHDMRAARRQYKAHPVPAPDSLGRMHKAPARDSADRARLGPDTAPHADSAAHADTTSHRIKGRRIDNPIPNGRAGV